MNSTLFGFEVYCYKKLVLHKIYGLTIQPLRQFCGSELIFSDLDSDPQIFFSDSDTVKSGNIVTR
jgi:hypothetical protein